LGNPGRGKERVLSGAKAIYTLDSCQFTKEERYMKKLIMAVLLFSLSVLSACGAPGHMMVKETGPDIRSIKPQEGKSALVIARTTSFGAAISFETFLDQKMIGVSRGKCYFVQTDIQPGTHYLIAKTESFETGKIDFEPDKVYYIQQTPRMGVWIARVTLSPVTPEHMASEMDTGCSYMEYDKTGETLSDEDFKEAVTDYEREITEGFHKEFTEYKGFPAK